MQWSNLGNKKNTKLKSCLDYGSDGCKFAAFIIKYLSDLIQSKYIKNKYYNFCNWNVHAKYCHKIKRCCIRFTILHQYMRHLTNYPNCLKVHNHYVNSYSFYLTFRQMIPNLFENLCLADFVSSTSEPFHQLFDRLMNCFSSFYS